MPYVCFYLESPPPVFAHKVDRAEYRAFPILRFPRPSNLGEVKKYHIRCAELCLYSTTLRLVINREPTYKTDHIYNLRYVKTPYTPRTAIRYSAQGIVFFFGNI